MSEVFEEIEFIPVSIELGEDKHGVAMFVTAKSGAVYGTRSSRVIWRVYRFYKRKAGFKKAKKFRELPYPDQSTLLTRLVRKFPRSFRVLLDVDGNVVNIVSLKHKQVPYSSIWHSVEAAIEEVFGECKAEKLTGRIRSFEMPAPSKYVAPSLAVDAGVNTALGRAAIYMYTRFKVTSSAFGQVPCLNWAQFWQRTADFFNVSIERTHSHHGVPLSEEFEAVLNQLNMRKIHIRSIEIKKDELISPLQQILAGAQNIDLLIEESLKVPLMKDEMDVIIKTYRDVLGLPDYVTKAILANVQEQTVWGFSNAISWVRTHTELKTRKNTQPFTSKLAWKLERIAGEMISVAPTIQILREKHGPITHELLIKPPKEYRAL